MHQNDYIKIWLEAPGVWAKDLIPNFAIIGNCRLGNGQGCHSLEGPGRGWKPYPGALPTTGLLVVWRPQSKDLCLVWGSLITDHPPSRPLRHAGWGLSIITGYNFAFFLTIMKMINIIEVRGDDILTCPVWSVLMDHSYIHVPRSYQVSPQYDKYYTSLGMIVWLFINIYHPASLYNWSIPLPIDVSNYRYM